MRIIDKMLVMDAVYWAPALTERDDYGRPLYLSPVEIKCRWEEVAEEFLNSQGERQVSAAKIFVDRDVKVGGVLLSGTLDSGVDEESPKQNEGAGEIAGFSKVPTLKATQFVRIAYLGGVKLR